MPCTLLIRHCLVLYYTSLILKLNCTIMPCTLLHFTALILNCTTMPCTLLFFTDTELHYNALNRTALYCIILHCDAIPSTTVHYNKQQLIALILNCSTVHLFNCIILNCNLMHWTKTHCTAVWCCDKVVSFPTGCSTLLHCYTATHCLLHANICTLVSGSAQSNNTSRAMQLHYTS